jgi:phosphate acetyltransferase
MTQFDTYEQSHPRLFALLAAARQKGAISTAVVFPNDEVSLQAVTSAFMRGMIEPTIYGNTQKIARLLPNNRALAEIAIIDTGESPQAAAQTAIAAIRRGEHRAIMKGSLHTDELLGEILHPENGLRTEARLTHSFVFDLPRYHKLLALTDAVVNIAPNAKTKSDALAHAIALMKKLGVHRAKCAIVAAIETENPAIPATLDAGEIVHLAKTGHFGDALVEGPFGFDNAISRRAAQMKGIQSEVAGDPDVILVPDLNSGNILYKSFVYVGGGECAGLVCGAKVPVILTSRADSEFSRVASCALAALAH